MNSTKVNVIEVDRQRIDQLIERLERTDLSAKDRETVGNILLSSLDWQFRQTRSYHVTADTVLASKKACFGASSTRTSNLS